MILSRGRIITNKLIFLSGVYESIPTLTGIDCPNSVVAGPGAGHIGMTCGSTESGSPNKLGKYACDNFLSKGNFICQKAKLSK